MTSWNFYPLLFASFFLLSYLAATVKCDWRTLEGSNNNLQNVKWGTPYLPYSPLGSWTPQYADGFNSLKNFTNARELTVQIFRPNLQQPDPNQLSQFVLDFAIVLFHDMGFRPIECPTTICEAAENLPITAPKCDEQWDPDCRGNVSIPFQRFRRLKGTGVNQVVRKVPYMRTAWLDMDFLYGESEEESPRINRPNNTVDSTRKGQIYGLTDPNRPQDLYTLNVVRVIPSIWYLSELFVRVHNSYASAFARSNSSWDEETVFQTARKWTIAIYQKIATREYVAAVTGVPLPRYQGYNSSLEPKVDPFVKHVIAKYGHFSVSDFVLLYDSNLKPFGPSIISTVDYWHDWNTYWKSYVKEVIRGQALQLSFDVNLQEPKSFGKFSFFGDISSTDIMRGRDLGFPKYNEMRAAYGLHKKSSFEDLTKDINIQNVLKKVYNSIDDVEAYYGVFSEDRNPGQHLGEFAGTLLRMQLAVLRDSDRFWYEQDSMFTSDELATIYNTTLSSLLKQPYYDIGSSFPSNPFFVANRQLSFQVDGLLYKTDSRYVNSLDLSPSYRLSWTYDAANNVVNFMLQVVTTGWVGIGFDADPGTMKNADIILCRILEDGTVEVRDSYALDVGVPTMDVDLGGTDDITGKSGETINGLTTIRFTKSVKSEDKWDKPIRNDLQKVIFAFNSLTTDLVYHGPTRSSQRYINLLSIKDTQDTNNALLILSAVVIAIGILIAIVVLIFTFLYEEHFKIFSTLFVRISTLGAIMGFISALLMLPRPTGNLCIASFWLLGVAFYIVFALTFLKIYRIYLIYLEISKSDLPDISPPSNTLLLSFMVIAVLLECVFHIIWIKVDSLDAIRAETDSYNWYKCDSSLVFWMIFVITKLAFMLACSVLCFLSRKIPEKYSEGGRLSLVVYAVFLISIIVLPLGFAVSDQNGRFVIQVFPIIITFLAYLILIFLPVITRIIQGKPVINAADLLDIALSRNDKSSL